MDAAPLAIAAVGRAGGQDDVFGRDDLGVPAAPPFLAHGRVLRAADRARPRVAGDADVAADALADVVETAFLDLVRQERVGDGRARRADQVEHAAPHGRDHRIGRGVAPHADHRLARERLDEGGVGFLVAFLRRSARWPSRCSSR
jgi:hypothetical protein